MRLLFITRKVDRNDSRVGFVHGWLNALSAELHYGNPSTSSGTNSNDTCLLVLCQEKGDTTGLVDDIEVFSMGKERGYGRFRQWWEMQKVLWKKRNQFDVVFVHMMPMYAIAAGMLCKIFRKPLYLWYVHKSVDWRLRLTRAFVKGYFTASEESFRMKTGIPIHIVGHGVDISRFRSLDNRSVIESDPDAASGERGNLVQTREMRLLRRKPSRNDDSIHLLTVGRISPAKNIHVMIDVVKELVARGQDVTLTIVGEPALERDREYYQTLQDQAKDLDHRVVFAGAKNQDEVVLYYQTSDIFLNFSETGSLDKTVLEAMACGCLVLTGNEAFQDMLKTTPECYTKNESINQLVEKIESLARLPEERHDEIVKQLRDLVVQNHSLHGLMRKIAAVCSGKVTEIASSDSQ